MKKICLMLLCLVLLTGCSSLPIETQKQYSATFITLFDTVTTVVGRAESEEAFRESIQPLHDELEYYHKLFDIYEEYDGMNNLKTLNDRAALYPVKVDSAVIELLQTCIDLSDATCGAFNPAMGSVLALWHEAREDGINDPENAYLPDTNALKEASLHTDPEDIIIDIEASTVFFADPDMKLDVGAIAKGWAVERACENAPENLLISVGGNVVATGPKDSGGTPWAVGIQDPDGGDYLNILNITHGSVVTSGSYQRAYAVDGKIYHHIIDPDTLYPSLLWTSVTVVCGDSGIADVLSTALFLLGREEGQRLLDGFDAEAMWVDSDGNKFYSPEFRDIIRK